MKNKVLVLVMVLFSVMMVSCFLKKSRIREHIEKKQAQAQVHEPVIEVKEVTLNFPPNTGLVSSIPATPASDKEILKMISQTTLSTYDRALAFCTSNKSLLEEGDHLIDLDWWSGLHKYFLQWLLYNDDPYKAGKIAWVLNDKVPCAKTLAKFANNRIQNKKYKFDYKLEVEVSRTYKITYKDGVRWECEQIMSETKIVDPLRDDRGILVNPQLPFEDPCTPSMYTQPFKEYPHMKFADPKVEENISWENRAAFWAGPKVVGQTRIMTRKVANIILYHPENMVRPEVLDLEFDEED